MNFQQLSEAIQSYTESTEQLFVQNIPNFVQLCEERVYNAVQIPAIRKYVIGTITSGGFGPTYEIFQFVGSSFP